MALSADSIWYRKGLCDLICHDVIHIANAVINELLKSNFRGESFCMSFHSNRASSLFCKAKPICVSGKEVARRGTISEWKCSFTGYLSTFTACSFNVLWLSRPSRKLQDQRSWPDPDSTEPWFGSFVVRKHFFG